MKNLNVKHTPGPWELEQDAKYIHIVNRNSDFGVCAIPLNDQDEIREIDIPNAHLIAAAPEMLEALERIAKDLNILLDEKMDVGLLSLRSLAEKTIAKARGKTGVIYVEDL